ncbi:MAG: hypothetical protein JW932_04625 [Deltaproteobacteria bacterium]|nr:hypothetical protein [Deltaproteobacteria bacterium]
MALLGYHDIHECYYWQKREALEDDVAPPSRICMYGVWGLVITVLLFRYDRKKIKAQES